jgi:hypothetical protein
LPSTPAEAILVVLVTTLPDDAVSGPVAGPLALAHPLIPAATADRVAKMGKTARICTPRR